MFNKYRKMKYNGNVFVNVKIQHITVKKILIKFTHFQQNARCPSGRLHPMALYALFLTVFLK